MSDSNTTEASVTINGSPLTVGQSMTLRVALETFAFSLKGEGCGDDEHGLAMTAAYMAAIQDIRKLIGLSPMASEPNTTEVREYTREEMREACRNNYNAAKPTWQPIETAPRDGTDIIVHRPGCKPNAYIPLVGTDYFKRGQWMQSNGATQPTHWMPLPKPPLC